jgi:hypothetical protein
MKSFLAVCCGLVVLGFGWGLGEARAQGQDLTVPPPPGLSPYLNLFRGGSNKAFNYFDVVRPQLQNQANIQGLQQQQTTLQQQLTQPVPQTAARPGSAKVPGYMTHAKYFGGNGTIAAGNGPTRRYFGDRAADTGSTQNRTPGQGTAASPFGGGTPNTGGVPGAQTRTTPGPVTPAFGPTGINPYSPVTTPFNPYRGF